MNGARGEIVYIVTNSSNEVTNVLVKFDNEQVGMQTHQSSQGTTLMLFHCMSKVEVVFLAKGKRGAEITLVHLDWT